MFLRATNRHKDGKDHRYFSIVENRRVSGGRTVQKTLLYLGEINDNQRAAWSQTIEVIERNDRRQVALFPEDRPIPCETENGIQLRMGALELRRPRQWGACWLASHLWEMLGLREFWEDRLDPSRKGTRWVNVLETLVNFRFIDPGSEWKLHRYWFDQSAMGDLLGEDFRIAAKDTLYRCHDKLLQHKTALFKQLRQKWEDLFGAKFEVLLYDLTSTYFESDPTFNDKRKFGYSRDKRFDCVQVVIALVVNTDGFPLAYEVLPGNTQDKQTLQDMLRIISERYGDAKRVWVMDRGIPTEEVLQEMKTSEVPVGYLVGTPRGHLSKHEKALSLLPWEQVRDDVRVKLLPTENEVYVLVESKARRLKEQGIRLRKMKRFVKRLKEIRSQKNIDRDNLLKKVGAAEKDAGRSHRLFEIKIPEEGEEINEKTFYWHLNRQKYRTTWYREGKYFLRSNQISKDPEELWKQYLVLTEVEESFRNLKGDLSLRPIYHRTMERVEAHIFISFLAYCLHVTLKQRARSLAPGLTPRSIIEQMKTIQMIDVHIPTVDGRELKMSRYTKPDKTQQILLAKLKLQLPPQPPPEITAPTPEQVVW
ncbi:MAG: IS1634 family transposase [Verrucomicrobiota bacterium]